MAKGNGKRNGQNGKPDKQDPTRDTAGRWIPGQSGNPNGRPKGIDYREAVEDYAKKKKVDIREAIGKVTLALIKEAEAGDTQAAKLLFDRNCGPLRQELDVTASSTVYVNDQDREALKALAADPETQALAHAAMKKRTT